MEQPLFDSTAFGLSGGTVDIGLLLWGVLAALLIVFCIFSAIILWHWKEYSTGKYTTVVNMLVYLGVSGGLLFLMVLSAVWYQFFV